MARTKENRKYATSGISSAFKVGNILKGLRDEQKSTPSLPNLPNVQAPNAGSFRVGEQIGGGTITTPFKGSTRFEKKGAHTGIDIAQKFGTPQSAFVGGKVTDVRTGLGQTKDPSFGNYVVVQDEKGMNHRYSHLAQGFVPVKVGQVIQKGDPIGNVGFSGSTYSLSSPNNAEAASHLDYRVYSIQNAYKKYVDPSAYIKEFFK